MMLKCDCLSASCNCVNVCLASGYTIAGTEYSGECFCDNDFQAGGAPVSDGRCSMTCNGNDGEICGGPNGLSILQFNGWYDQGCYTDNVGGRTLRYGKAVTGGAQNMTVENCVTSCKKAGYTIAGVEYAGECFCDNTVSNGGGPAPDGSTGCNMQCNGNQDQTCGGPNRLNVYAFNSTGLPTATKTSTTAPLTTATSAGNGGNGTTTNTPTQTTPTADT